MKKSEKKGPKKITEKIVKQVLGVDISKDSFYACYTVLYSNGHISIKGHKCFDNNLSGMKSLILWCQGRNKTLEVPLYFVMEATGVYHEELSYFLFNENQKVSIQLASKIKYFAKSCNKKSKTDKEDSEIIAHFGIEKNIEAMGLWQPPSKKFRTIRFMSREHTSLIEMRTMAMNQQHALEHSYSADDEVVKLKKEQLEFYDKQIKTIEKQMTNAVKSDDELNSKIENIKSINGLGIITVIKIVTETNGFKLFTNIKQLVSYAGLDVIESESGNTKGKTKISKKGNVRIRSALYMPALSAIQNNEALKLFYDRINEGRTIKKQGVVAVMRKMLILIYTLWKKDEKYDKDYYAKHYSSGNDED